MTVANAQELLQREVKSLSEELAQEVLDFVLFLRERRAEETYLWERVEETLAFRENHPVDTYTVSADAFLEATADHSDT